MAFGLDYVSGPPIAALQAAGVFFVCRYLSEVNPQTSVKLLTPEEAKSLSAAGIAIVSNYEWYAERALEGEAAGVADAKIAESQHAACGGPADRPIYFSVDFDVTANEEAQVAAYFRGVASVLGLHRTGAYGGMNAIRYLFDAGLIAWGWQTYAWSGGQWDGRAHLQQYQNGVILAGHRVDYNRSTADDFGQWSVGEETMKIDLSIPEVASHFSANGATWLCKQTGKPIGGAILTFYQSYGNAALCGLTFLGLPLSGEKPIQSFAGYEHLAGKGIVLQPFERGIAIYDPTHEYDNPPGAGAVYLAHLYSGAGVDPEVAQLQAQLTAARAQSAAPQEHAALVQIKDILSHVS